MRLVIPLTPAFSYQRISLVTHTLKPPLLRHLPSRLSVRLNSTAVSLGENAPAFEYQWIDGVEKMERCRPGGYHPISIGDILVDRYQVTHKLGYGGYSTTWLARDKQNAAYIAVKISTADAPPHEVEILDSLKSQSNHLGRIMIPLVQDQFELEGPNGRHRCYVTSPARCSVDAAQSSTCFSVETARVLVTQLIIAVAYMHTRGFVHGDIHLGNVLLRLPSSFDQLSTDQLYEKFGEPCKEEIVRFDGEAPPPNVPIHGIMPAWLGKRAKLIPPSEGYLLLSDFGETFSPATQQRLGSECHTPIIFRSPEAVFEPERPVSFPSDIWGLACATWSILGLRSLFDGVLATQDYITSQQIDILGISSFPSEWWSKWDARNERFDELGHPKEGRRSVRPSLECLFQEDIQDLRREKQMDEFDKEEAAAILVMLRSMLVFRPDRRVTAESLMVSEWMLNWGIPELKKVWEGLDN
ncbi:hypothetical protein FQN49_004982 [Arthroderma sp. PD_2]|nr:hypothetical protein FQN49_004982 [Arthroderma sp. PD_2]